MATLSRATSVLAKGDWHDAVDSVILDYAERRTNHLHLQGLSGTEFLLDLAHPADLRHGDALHLEDGRLIEVVASPESLLEIKGEPHQIASIAYHLGNLHKPVQVSGTRLRVRMDEAMRELAVALGAKAIEIEAAFDPEGGNYARAKSAPQDHVHHDHAHHEHSHHDHVQHEHGHHDHAHHVHGPDCTHD